MTLQDKLFFAPIENPASAIDIGTGTGIWAMDMADAYPGCDVLGVDLSPIQPGYVPPNCSFQVMDLEDEWDMADRFDLIHTREMSGFAIKDWSRFYNQSFASLKPGGWVESQEFDLNISSDDNTMPENSKVMEWQTLWEQGISKAGMTCRCYPEKMKQDAEAAGFINVTVLPFKMPIGTWPKDKTLQQSGLYTLVGLLDGVSGLSLRVFTQLLGWTVEEMEVLLADVRKEWKNKKVHTYFPMYVRNICASGILLTSSSYVVYGQKPPQK